MKKGAKEELGVVRRKVVTEEVKQDLRMGWYLEKGD